MSEPLTVFISYAHADEPYKERLLSHLKILQRQKLIKTWNDRQIDGGSDWRADIGQAMDDCQLALLLVSDAFLASDFIQSVEMVRLLARRQSEGIRVVPIIVRPCMWHLDDIGAVQALPKDGKPIITFPEENGQRDEVWTAIGHKIRGWAADFIAGQNGATSNLPTVPVAPIPSLSIPNPFNPWQPAIPPHFFGRADVLRALHVALDEKRSVSLVGDRRIGKTSLLNTWKIKAEAMGRTVRLLSGEGPEAVSCASFIHAITATNIAFDDADCAANALTAWLEKSPGLPPLILLDEAEEVLLRLPHRFFERLRGLVGQQKVCLVLASRQPVDQVYQDSGRTSPFMNLLEMRRVALLDEAAAQQMIAQGEGVFDADQRALMGSWAGRHPYFLALFGRRLWEACQGGGGLDAMLDEVNDEAAGRLRELWQTLSERERGVLNMVVDGVAAVTTVLRLRGLVVGDAQGDRVFGEVLAAWLRGQR